MPIKELLPPSQRRALDALIDARREELEAEAGELFGFPVRGQGRRYVTQNLRGYEADQLAIIDLMNKGFNREQAREAVLKRREKDREVRDRRKPWMLDNHIERGGSNKTTNTKGSYKYPRSDS